jgi:hypothetical protein
MRNHEGQRREPVEQVVADELHEHAGIGVEVVGTKGVEIRVARGRDVHHGGHVELHHRLIERIPVLVGHRRCRPVATGGIGVQVAPDEAEFVDAPSQFVDHRTELAARRLRQLCHGGERLRVQLRDPMHQIIRGPGPRRCDRLVGDVVFHAGRLRRQQHQITAPLPQDPQLVEFDALPDLVVTDLGDVGHRVRRIIECGELFIAKVLKRLRCGGVVAVDVDDHRPASS